MQQPIQVRKELQQSLSRQFSKTISIGTTNQDECDEWNFKKSFIDIQKN